MQREELIDRIVRRYHGRGINFVKLKALIRRFLQNNPDADPESIDWTAVYDDSMEFDELVEVFKREYPTYKWGRDEPMAQEEYEDSKVNYIIAQAEDLSEDSLKSLINALEERLGIERQPADIEVQHPDAITSTQAVQTEAEVSKTATIEKAVQTTAPPKVVVDMRLLAKYPWLEEAREFLKAFYINKLSPEVVNRGRERIMEALERGELGVIPRLDNPFVELLSFPVAKAVVSTVSDDWLKRRWALAESARCERLLHLEQQHVFDFLLRKLELAVERHGGEYRIRFNHYLMSAGDLLRDVSWKLVNQKLDKGWVYLSKTRLARIVRQHLYRSLYKSFENTPKMTNPPEPMATVMADVVKKLQEIKARQRPLKALGRTPPCMDAIKNRLADASHTENFAYAAFLINRGHGVEEVVREFSVRSDFREDVAKYQVEHIAGLRGSRVKYRPPSCQTMKSLGLCVKDGQLCPRNIRNPLDY
ncbi:MAG: hypothetical protein QW217_08430 [Candidatus Caldarchaeum sp.]